MADGLALAEITAANVRAVCDLAVAPDQAGFVAPNGTSLAEAAVEPAASPSAIVLDGVPVGFALLYDPTLPGVTAPDPDLPPDAILLWRLMVDARHHGRGLGRRALALLGDHARLGFAPTGRVLDDESEAIFTLDPLAPHGARG